MSESGWVTQDYLGGGGVRQMKKRKERPINSGGNKNANELGKTTTRSPASLDLLRTNLLTFYPPAP